jgi:hypothetical protein
LLIVIQISRVKHERENITQAERLADWRESMYGREGIQMATSGRFAPRSSSGNMYPRMKKAYVNKVRFITDWRTTSVIQLPEFLPRT